MDGSGSWRLSPAYDLCHSMGPGGEHSMSILGEGREPGATHCLELARSSGIKAGDATAVLDEVGAAVGRWHEFADEARLARKAALRLGKTFVTLRKR